MRALQITLGLAAGVATGLGVALMKRDSGTRIESKTVEKPKSDLEKEINNIKRSFSDILSYVNDIKTESQTVAGSIGGEVKTMIGEFQSDIDPNIKRLQSHIENLQNRGEEITNFPSKK
ncbi:YtxH domain-containing protein [Staphylococcus hyicus]|uniref:YtxH domain-containing protein n=1 Tax=Staphylococcus hyicus TaxID=1284 RepID=UPI00208EE4D5|nr:YtxH domain-containing protein [Staphylococcus hyicus]MCO4328177.1 YtxH domain-containing protein [Staphylococcus hyicus]MCO4336456.1 YtxH domain-containing protein [Staphylococcus hyicus]